MTMRDSSRCDKRVATVQRAATTTGSGGEEATGRGSAARTAGRAEGGPGGPDEGGREEREAGGDAAYRLHGRLPSHRGRGGAEVDP